MSIVKKEFSGTSGDPNLDRLFRDLYFYLGEIVDSLGTAQSSVPSDIEGKLGQVQVIKQADNTYIVSVRAKDGWIRSTDGTFIAQDKI
jgi:hypothetical protein